MVRIVRTGELVVERTLHELHPSQDPAALEQGESPVDRGAGEAPPLAPQPEPKRLRVEVPRRLGDRLGDEPARLGDTKMMGGKELGPALECRSGAIGSVRGQAHSDQNRPDRRR